MAEMTTDASELSQGPFPHGPLVTVLTVTYNHAEGFARTLESVAAQRGVDLEYVVVDGASQDRTEQIAKHPRVDTFLSKPDRGISHAFNRGIDLARGRWLLFLNAGDAFNAPDALARLANHIPGGRPALVSGQVDCGPKGIFPLAAPATTGPARHRARLAHQATLIPREFFDEYGRFDESFRIRMDYEWLLRLIDREPIHWVPEVFVTYELGGLSSDPRRALQQEIEAMTAEMLHAGSTAARVWHLLWRGPLALMRALAKRVQWSLPPAIERRVTRWMS
ncbi:MAG: glycosyltransferase [Deltaproteobacteria bacterium]|nr:glycosyltransferase [Deltaproteobacteria bacterium]MBW2447269.1 glycosyltransferase [Deltaproteobacteria bacterium]